MKRLLAAVLSLTLLVAFAAPVLAAEDVQPGAPEDYGKTWAYYGDLNNDQKANAADALTILRVSVAKQTLNDTQKILADVTADKAVNAADALDVLRASVGKLTVFKAGSIYSWGGGQNPPKPPEPTGNPVVDYDKSNSVNGAYEDDKTADTSFSADVSSLPKLTIYRYTGGSSMPSTDYARLMYSLQGLINRDFGKDEDHTTLLFINRDSSDANWFSYMTGSAVNKVQLNDSILKLGTVITEKDEYGNDIPVGYEDDGLQAVRVASSDELYEIMLPVIKSCGMILWDGNVPATANVAATICGLEGYLPVLAQSPLHEQLKADGVPEKMSLVGLFENGKKGQSITGTSIPSTGSAKNDAYLWALEKYFDRCSSTYLAYILDGAVTLKDYEAYEDNPTALLKDAGQNCLSNMDYLIARRAFCFDLAVYKGEAACDDPAQQNGQADPGTDHETMMKIFAARYKRAGGAIGQLMGFPPWWVKYTTHNNQGGQVDTWIEWLFTEYVSCYNLAKEADAAQPSSMTNGSVFYKYVPEKAQYENNRRSQDLTFDKDTFYFLLYVGDYDSSAWMKEHVNTFFMGPQSNYRGQIPLMWSFNPNLSYRIPMAFDYVYNAKTNNDYFAAGDSGAGYIIPEGLFHDRPLAYMGESRPAENADAGQLWADYCKTFYQRFDLDITGFIINGANNRVSKNIAATFNQFSTVGSFTNCTATRLGVYEGVPYVYLQNGVGPQTDPKTLYDHAMTTMNAGFNFSGYRTVVQSPSVMIAIVRKFETYAATHNLKVQYCDPYTYFKVLKQSGQGTPIES